MSHSRPDPSFTPGERGAERPQGRAAGEPRPPADRPVELPADVAHPRRRATDFANPLHDALATLAIGLAVVDGEWTLTYVNDALALLVGRPAAELGGRPLADVFPAMRGGVEHALIRRTMEDGQPRSFRVAHEVEGRTFEVRAARSAGQQLVLEVRDATAIVKLEREHERALESIGEALFVVDTQWRVTYWNSTVARLSGVARTEATGIALWDALPWLRGTELEGVYRAAMRDRRPRELSRWSAPETKGRTFDVRCYPVPDNGLLVLIAEVSEELRREQALAEASGENALLRELAGRLAHTPDSEALLGMLCEIVRRECRASGAGVSAVQGPEVLVLASIGEGMPPAGFVMPIAGSLTAEVVTSRRVLRRRAYRSAFAPLQRHVETGDVGEKMIAPLVAYDQVVGVLVTVRRTGEAPFTERDERRLRLVADHAALALWKSRLLEQAQAANEAKSAFLATVSHELRTPLTALTGYGELLADETIVGPLTGPQQEMVERMCSVTHHLTALIDELLTFSSIETGRESVRADDVSSGDLLRAAVAVAEPGARQKGLAVHVLVPPDAPIVRTDPDKVRQILVNLAGNAVKFTDHGAITFSLTAHDGTVRFGVRDTGIGIPAADRWSIFQPFAQLESGLTRRYGGSGLGLYISSRLAGLLGGRIELESTPGVGSLFELVLPREGAKAR